MVHHHSYFDDKSSMESISNSAGKTSQQPGSMLSSCSSPPQSRDQSPVRFPLRVKPQSPIFEERQEIFPSPVLNSSLSSFEGHGQSVAVNVCSTEVPQHGLALSKPDEAAKMSVFEQGDCSVPMRPISADSPDFLSLSTVGGMFDEPHDSSAGESELLSLSDDSDDEDLDLEQSADKFLSEKFGISLSRLKRPHRIIYAFQQVKNQCVGILEDEGHHFVGSPRSEESRSELVDGGDTHHPTPADRSYSTTGSSFTSSGRKRLSNDAVDSEGFSGSGSLVKTRRFKKRRIGGEFSCPYRKRNPRRFNVRDHEECANRSYKDISMLKKHITAYHCKEDALLCERCNQNYRTQDALLAHLRQCPHPPPNRPIIRYTDPEDGIEDRTDYMLRSRKLSDQISDWETLWKRLFPIDKVVPCSDFEPVIEDHDLAYIYKCSQPRILQRLDELVPGPSSKQIKAFIFEEIDSLLRCRGTHDQNPTLSSSSSTSLPIQSRSRDSDIVIVERESDLAANALVPDLVTEVSNTQGLRPPMQSGARGPFEKIDTAESSLTDPIHQPLTRYDAPVVPDNETYVELFAGSTQPFRETSQRPFGLTLGNSELDMLQSPAQSQSALFSAGTIPLHRNTFPQTQQDGPWFPNNGYFSIENDLAVGWTDFPGLFGNENLDYTGC